MKSGRAFTLIELLVVIAIIAILAALLFPVLARAKEKGYKVQCASNLKQLATAIQLYSDDHGDHLPGPLWAGQYDAYSITYPARLPYYIATYCGMPAPSATPQVLQIARCPAAEKHWTKPPPGTPIDSVENPLSYTTTRGVTNYAGTVVFPFGYPNRTNVPTKLIREITDPSSTWAMVDADQDNSPDWARFYRFLSPTPAHRTVRNTLYFDWHVEAAKVVAEE